MESVVARLPSVLGSLAALVVAFISFLIQVSPAVCLMRAFSAFVVFAAFGIVIRYLLGDAASLRDESARAEQENDPGEITPGTPVADLLGERMKDE
jgi:hypothetical protein